MKITQDGSIAYADFKPGGATPEGVQDAIAKAKAKTAIDYLEIYEVDDATPGRLGHKWLATWRVRDAVRIKP